MLFSSNEVADYINATFEPAWESLRPAPLVTIDFGNGNVVKRTLQGNIATYICAADGVVYDVLPGIYSPEEYRKQLELCKIVAQSLAPYENERPITTFAGAVRVAINRAEMLSSHHTSEAAALSRLQQPPQFRAIAQIGGGFKGGGGIGGGFANFGGGNFGNVSGGHFSGSGFGGGWAPNGSGFGGIEGPTERVIAGLPALPAPATAAAPLAKRPELCARLASERADSPQGDSRTSSARRSRPSGRHQEMAVQRSASRRSR